MLLANVVIPGLVFLTIPNRRYCSTDAELLVRARKGFAAQSGNCRTRGTDNTEI